MEVEGTANTDSTVSATDDSLNAGLVDTNTETYQPDYLTGQLSQYHVIRRNGKVTAFDLGKISVAMTKAFINVEGGTAAASTRIHQIVESLSQQVVNALTRRMPDGGTLHIEDIQDQVELSLMRAGEQKIARAYVIYREERSRERAAEAAINPASQQEIPSVQIHVKQIDGQKTPLDETRLRAVVTEACEGFSEVDAEVIIQDSLNNLFDGMDEADVGNALVMCARTLIEKEPDYTHVAACLLLDKMRQEALTFIEGAMTQATHQEMAERYGAYFKKYISTGSDLGLIDHELTKYDLDRLGDAIQADRDRQFTYLGLQTLYDRYFIHSDEFRFELPQAFFMRVAMGLAINELDREGRAIEF